jgi:hypothetical protein
MDKVLIGFVYTDYKYYCRPLYPGNFDILKYKNKEVLFVTDKMLPGLSDHDQGEQVAAAGRNFIIHYARKHNFDWIFFLDIDVLPEENTLDLLLKEKYPFIGGSSAGRGNSTLLIGHNYRYDGSLERLPLVAYGMSKVIKVDGISGAVMLVNKSIFNKVDYSGYKGQGTILNRFTADDEYFCLQVKKKCNIKPLMHLGAKVWHFNNDGFAYRYYGDKKPFKRERDIIIFEGHKYIQK